MSFRMPTVGEAFPADDDAAQWATVMALIANDLTRSRDALVTAAHADSSDGDFGYQLRALVGHLLEGTQYMVDCWSKAWAEPLIEALGEAAAEAHKRLDEAYADSHSVLSKLRDVRNATFHYGPIRRSLPKALHDHADEPLSVTLEQGPPLRFAISTADRVALDALIADLDIAEDHKHELFALVDPLVDDLMLVCAGVAVGQMQRMDTGHWA